MADWITWRSEAHRNAERLEKLVLDYQAALKAAEIRADRLKVELEDRGKVNASLNKRLAESERKFKLLTRWLVMDELWPTTS